jgi:hypothetical protein
MPSNAGRDPAITLAVRLRRECRADIVDVNPLPEGLTIHLAIPSSGLIPMKRLRRDLWMSFVSSNVETRKDGSAKVRLRLASQREALGRSHAIAEHNRARLMEYGST